MHALSVIEYNDISPEYRGEGVFVCGKIKNNCYFLEKGR